MPADRTRADAAPRANRYVAVEDCTDRTLVVDAENDDAWVRSDEAVDLGEWQ